LMVMWRFSLVLVSSIFQELNFLLRIGASLVVVESRSRGQSLERTRPVLSLVEWAY
jgi:hypothetical protein